MLQATLYAAGPKFEVRSPTQQARDLKFGSEAQPAGGTDFRPSLVCGADSGPAPPRVAMSLPMQAHRIAAYWELVNRSLKTRSPGCGGNRQNTGQNCIAGGIQAHAEPVARNQVAGEALQKRQVEQ